MNSSVKIPGTLGTKWRGKISIEFEMRSKLFFHFDIFISITEGSEITRGLLYKITSRQKIWRFISLKLNNGFVCYGAHLKAYWMSFHMNPITWKCIKNFQSYELSNFLLRNLYISTIYIMKFPNPFFYCVLCILQNYFKAKNL